MSRSGFIGVLMLDTRFPRPLGDAGNAESYGMPARLRVVPNAGSPDIVHDAMPSEHLVQAFILAARGLEAEGACAIVSTCGFLIRVQAEIAQAVRVPVMLSALSLVPMVRAAHGKRPVGVLTASASELGPDALYAAGIAPGDVRLAGMEDCGAFKEAILRPKAEQSPQLDQDAIRAAAIAKAEHLCTGTADLAAFVLECGNLPPYAAEIEAATGRQVYSILDGARLIAKRGGLAGFETT